ncbi:MAG: hypothetical protein EOO10_21435 [Chitinophagaceae bacterium]|nr:MAG: hypothetical protein EOO10_21435 [Chitinophagaceae bacterium]
MMEKNCSKCNSTFTCQNETRGCWCESVKLSPETLVQLKENYENCLCPNCLQSLDERKKKINLTNSSVLSAKP